MARRSARMSARRIKVKGKPNSRRERAKSAVRQRIASGTRNGMRAKSNGRVKIVRSRSTGARKPSRPLPAPESFGERPFLSSLERSLRDYRQLWEALAKR
jgi:hypothetical protein